jgi:hypothetical protein
MIVLLFARSGTPSPAQWTNETPENGRAMRVRAADVQVVAALTLAVAAAVISTPAFQGLFAKARFMLLEAGSETDTAVIGNNPSGIAPPP